MRAKNGYISRRKFMRSTSLAMAAAAMGTMSCSSGGKRPNILLILADDMGYSDLGCFGSEINTPNLDHLAYEGTRFSQFYNNARCCPSRAVLLSGLYPHQAGIGGMTDTNVPISEYQGYFKDNTITIADLLREAGYATYLAGKWHCGEEPDHWPVHHGFDRSFSFINGASSYFDFKPYRNEKWPPGNELTLVMNEKPVNMDGEEFYATDLYTDHAIQFLREHNPSKPFFLYMSYTAPHWPLHALPEDIEKYEGIYDKGWDYIREKRYRKMKELGIIDVNTKLSPKDSYDREWDKLSAKEKKREARLMTVYAAMIDRMDQNIGRLIRHLRDNKQLDDTIIMFTSDNGGCAAGNLAYSKYAHSRFNPEAPAGSPDSFTGYGRNWANVSNTPFRMFKSHVHEGGVATPFIVWNPKRFAHGRICATRGHIVDIMPTLAELAGTRYPSRFKGKTVLPNEGVSLVQTLRDRAEVENRTLYFEHMGNCAVIDGDWKLVRLRDKEWELYYLKDDRSELNNLAYQQPEKFAELKKEYEKWAKTNKVLPRKEVEKKIPYKF